MGIPSDKRKIVRHRIASFAQESTRFCCYGNDKFGNEITFIKPFMMDENSDEYLLWHHSLGWAENAYMNMIHIGIKPEIARSVLPNSLKTEVVMTANYREWRSFFRLRTAENAHPQMREVTVPLLDELKMLIPVVFDDIG